jgi:hypothetical protein
MLAVIKPSWAMFTPVPEPPSMLIFLGPQPEPPDIVFKKYQEFRNDLKAQAIKNKKSLDEIDFGVILAVPKPSLGMVSPIPLSPNMLLFLSPQPEPPDIAFKRYKSYLSILKSWSNSISISVDELITIAEQLGQESQNF